MKTQPIIFLFTAIILLMSFKAVSDVLENKTAVLKYTMGVLQDNFVDEVDVKELYHNAMRAAVGSLDPYCAFYDEEETKKHLQKMDGVVKIGIGVYMFYREGYAIVSSVNAGSPAEKNDIRVGDAIVEIDGRKIYEFFIKDVDQLLQGELGTEVKLVIDRPGFGEKKKIINRENVLRKIVPYFGMLNDSIGYIKMNHFWGMAGDSLQMALDKLNKENNLKGLILDLKNNNGGSVTEARRIANLFLPKDKVVYYIKEKNKDFQPFKTEEKPLYPDLPLAIVANEYSASASELVSGALQDYDRAVIIGDTTVGKGLMQQTWNLGDGTSMYFTFAKYYTPLKRCIQKIDYSKMHLGEEETFYSEKSKSLYKTKNNRQLKDFEGIVPDVLVEKKVKLDVVRNLEISFPFFDFVNTYRNSHESIENPSEYNFSDVYYDLFVEFLKKENYNFYISSQSHLETFEQNLTDELKVSLKEDIQKIRQKLNEEKLKKVYKHKKEIKQVLEHFIVNRFYNLSGEFEYLARNDQEILTALKIIADKQQFKAILIGNE